MPSNGLVTRVNRRPTGCAVCLASSILLSRSHHLRPLHTGHAEPRHHRAVGAQQAQYVSIPIHVIAVRQHERDTYPHRPWTTSQHSALGYILWRSDKEVAHDAHK